MVLDSDKQIDLDVTKSNRGFWDEFKMYKILLWPCGLWPFEKRRVNRIFFYLMASASQIFIIVLLFKEIYKARGTPADLLDSYALFNCYMMSLIKLTCIGIHFLKTYRICLCAWKNWTNVKDENVMKIMQRYAKKAKKFYYIQASTTFCLLILYITNPFILPRDDASNLPIQTVCSLRNLSNSEYISVYVIQSISLFYAAFGLIGIDIYFFGIVMHLCAQLKILQIEYNSIGKATWHLDYVRLMTLLAKKHSLLIMLASDLKIIFSFVLLLQFIMSTFLVTSQSVTFLIALKINNKFLAFKSTQSFPILFLEIFLYCYAGQLLHYEFSNITNSIYNSHWYLLPPKLRQYYLIFTMTAGNKSFRLTAGRLVNVDMSLFFYFVKTMFSFFSIILLMFDKHADQ